MKHFPRHNYPLGAAPNCLSENDPAATEFLFFLIGFSTSPKLIVFSWAVPLTRHHPAAPSAQFQTLLFASSLN